MRGLMPIALGEYCAASTIRVVCYDMHTLRLDTRQGVQLGVELPEAILNSVASRQFEYLAGRYCAAQALRQLGALTSIVGRNDDGSPHWPKGTLGSLSHTADRVIACAAYQSLWLGLGIDIEKTVDTSMLVALEHFVLTPIDRLQIEAAPLTVQEAATLVFSAKEAFYKFIYPRTHAQLDFKDVSLLEIKDGAFVMEIHKDIDGDWRKDSQVRGTYGFESNNVITLIAQPHRAPSV